MVEAGKDTLNGIIEDERTFYYLASLDDEDDDINDSENWIKANPNIGVSIDIEVMKEEWIKQSVFPQNVAILLLNDLISLLIMMR